MWKIDFQCSFETWRLKYSTTNCGEFVNWLVSLSRTQSSKRKQNSATKIKDSI